MRALKLEIDWEQSDNRLGFEAPVRIVSAPGRTSDSPSYTRELASKVTTARCPHCASIVYSRRNKLCGVCNQSLPQTILFDPAEAEKIEQLLARERHRHRLWMERYSDAR
ncbi:MAG: hypothetical protein HYY23_10255 [Verrucomicrobia bacterium]|nr:hypothetical protein [Verrucomicrobiota bacterium]